MLAKDLPLPARDLVSRLAGTNSQELLVIVGVQLGHEHLHVLPNDVLFLGVAKDLAQAHVALIDDAQALLLARDVDAWCPVLGIVVQVREVLIGIVEFKVHSKVSGILGLKHLFIACFLVIKDLYQVGSV